MKTLIYAAVALAITAPISAEYASAITESSPHIHGTVQFPQNRSRIVRHTIRLCIPQGSSHLSQLTIDVPEGLRASDNITITNNSGQKINADVAIMGNKVIINFPQPITPDSKLELDLNYVERNGISNAWLYRVAAKFVDSDTHIPIGTAQIRVHH